MIATVDKVEPGQVWEWDEPSGRRKRLMLVQRVTEGPPRRAFGIHPQSGRALQCTVASLLSGKHGARLVRVVEGYSWQPARSREVGAQRAREFYKA